MRNDSCNIKDDTQLKENPVYSKCYYQNCDPWNNLPDETIYTESNATVGKYKIRREFPCNPKMLFMKHIVLNV